MERIAPDLYLVTTRLYPLAQGQSSPWNIGMAYRIPDTNINLSGSYQQGKGTIQVSCVPDESLPLLGPNGELRFPCFTCAPSSKRS